MSTSGPSTPARRVPAWLRALESPGAIPRALRWASVASAALVISALLVGPRMGSYSLLGAQTAQAGWRSPLRPRLARLAGAGVAVLVGEALGMLVSPHRILIPLMMGAFTYAVMWCWHAVRLGSPGPVNIIMGAAMGTYMGLSRQTAGDLLAMTLLGWALASTLSVLVLLTCHHLPEREAVAEASDAVDALLSQTSASVQDATVLRYRAWTRVHRAFAVLLADRRPGSPIHSPAVRALLDRLTGLYRQLIARVQDELSLPASVTGPITPRGDPPMGYLLHTARSFRSQPTLLAARAALAVALAAALSLACGVDRPYWAMLSAAIVLHMGAARHDLTIRALHRVIGTCIGVALFFVVQRLAPGNWVRVGIVVAALYLTELVIARMYALGVTFITLYALLTLPIRTEIDLTTAIKGRVLETVIGVGFAVLLTRLLGRRSEQAAVQHQYVLTMAALRVALVSLARRDRAGDAGAPRRNLVFELGRTGTLLLTLQSDRTREGRLWLDVHRALTELGYELIAVSEAPGGLDPRAAQGLERAIGDFPSPADDLAALVGSIHRAAAALRSTSVSEAPDHPVDGES